MSGPDAVVVGSGPNGLAAALTLAPEGWSVRVIEGDAHAGGGCRSEEVTLPGFTHDLCASVHPLLVASPFFRQVDLASRGVRLVTPKVAFAHPLDGGRAAAVSGSVEETAAALGPDGPAYQHLYEPLVRRSDAVVDAVMGSLREIPERPISATRFAVVAVLPASRLATRFRTEHARALLAGAAAHAGRPLDSALTAGFGLLLTALAHSGGWPVVEGGSQALVSAMIEELEGLGGTVETGRWVRSLAELPAARAVLLDVAPRAVLELAGDRLPSRYRRALGTFQYGAGVHKVDWALSGPVPWEAPVCREAVTLHVGGTFEEVAEAEAAVAAGRHPERPFCIVVQAGVVDPTRAPSGGQTLWGYCHVPPGSDVDMTERVEAQVERFAPGFSRLIQARTVRTAAQMEAYNPNYVGGDINGGAATLLQTFLRPAARWNPYRTGVPGLYLCSASTPPGGGVHGMCGARAARTALADLP
ncbi:MAG: phytoene desaturase family protein [Acidimicrobiales bacterium]